MVDIHIDDSGTWRKAKQVWVDDSGTWRKVYAKVDIEVGGITDYSITELASLYTYDAYALIRLKTDGSIVKIEASGDNTGAEVANGRYVAVTDIEEGIGELFESKVTWTSSGNRGSTNWVSIDTNNDYGEVAITSNTQYTGAGSIYVRQLGDSSTETLVGTFTWSATVPGSGGGGGGPPIE